MTTTQQCRYCDHPMDPHTMTMMADADGQPIYAGLVTCPECDCLATFAMRTPDGGYIGGDAAKEFLAEVGPTVDAQHRQRQASRN